MERIFQKRYRILRHLGRGGLGNVYLCDDLRLPGKQWALKQMQIPEEEMVERFRDTFEREAAILSRLRHPNLPVIVDYFEEGNECYLAMEFVEGENLAEYVRRRGPMGETAAFQIGRTLAELLTYLHSQKPPVIFRDLKPDNVMVTPDGTLKLIDFGLARRFVPGKRSDTVPSGSVGYAPPEQWEDLAQTDERSDVYSWGATMVHLHTGKIPSPVFPLAALRALDPPLTERGGEILQRAMRSRPTERYPSAHALLREVESHLLSLAAWWGVERPAAPVAAAPPGRGPSPVSRPAVGAEPSRAGTARRLPLRAVSAPLLLLVLATLAFLAAVAASVPHRSRAPVAPPPSAAPPLSGVGPYQLKYVSDQKREEGRRLYEQGFYNQAVDVLDQATTQYPDDAEAHILKEDAYLKLTHAPTITVPFIGSLTGVDAPDALSQLPGLSLAQSNVNERGGVRGRKVIVDVYDDESSTSHCLQIAEKLARNPRVEVVLGPYNSQRTLAVAPIFNAAHLALIAPVSSARKVWESGPYVFSAADSSDRRVRALARHLTRVGFKRIGVVEDSGSRLSREMTTSLQDELKADPVQILTLPAFNEEDLDFAPQIAAIRRLRPDVVFFSDYRGATTAQFARQLRAQGLTTPICSQTIPFTADLVSAGGTAVDGLLLSGYFHPDMNTPQCRAFMAAFRRRFGSLTPTHVTACTYDAFNAALQGLAACSTREALAHWLRRHGAFDGVAGRFSLGRRLDARAVWIISVEHGLYRLVESRSEDAAHAAAPEPVNPGGKTQD